ncbi:MAG TPA: hypothetical protein VFL96_12680 [Acidobacteriaceae bacterium]|jgi:hypothetical protein|nr:hypothetical protein [Acidobacteriaceae bacterium]
MPDDPELSHVREFANKLRNSLPSSIGALELGVRSKAPFQLLCTREALIWRTEELARNACDAVERDDLSIAAILTRALTESAALAWKLMEILEARAKHAPEELNEILMRLLFGTKNWSDMPDPFHVLSCIDRLDKKVPGARHTYDCLSEIAHPNWAGVCGLYSKIDAPTLTARFGRGLWRPAENRALILNAMHAALGLFECAYNRISDLMPAFLTELESIWPAEKKPGGEPS